MGLPAIATNYSGPTAFMTDANSFPLPVAKTLDGGQAEPSVAGLRRAMRDAYDERGTEEAAERSRLAVEGIGQYSRAAVAAVVVQRLREIADEIGSKGDAKSKASRD